MAELYSLADFLSRIVVWHGPETPGLTNLHWTSPKHSGFAGRPYTSIADFITQVEWLKRHPDFAKEIYFCLGQQRTCGPPTKSGQPRALRNKANTTLMKALYVDLDVKEKGYGSILEALDAIKVFCESVKIPYPSALVNSGGGLHCYWISDVPLTVAEWQVYANGLHSLALQHGLRCDHSVTIDCARVLRVPGTFNRKTEPPRPVKTLKLAPAGINFATALHPLTVVQPHRSQATVPSRAQPELFDPALFPQQPVDAEILSKDYQAQVSAQRDAVQVKLGPVAKQCPFFNHTMAAGGADADQGLWNLAVLATTFAEKGRKWAHELSKGYKGYTVEETDAMFDRKDAEREERQLGWPSCQTFEQYGSKQCAGCKHKGKIKSPLNLLDRMPEPRPTPTAPAPAAFSVMAPPPPEDKLFLPKYDGLEFFVSSTSGLISVIAQKGKGKLTYPEETPIFLRKVHEAWAEKGKVHGLNFLVETDSGSIEHAFVPTRDFGTYTAISNALGQSHAMYDDEYIKMRRFMAFWMQKVWNKGPAVVTEQLGWVREKNKIVGWAYNNIVHKVDGSTQHTSRMDAATQEIYTPTGDEALWFQALKLITDQHRPALEAIAAAAFAAPLVPLIGNAGCLAAFSQTTQNKSTACLIGLGVWGNPTKSKLTGGASPKSILKKLGTTRHLPTYWDDVKTDQDGMDQVTDTIHAFTQNIDDAKLKASREFEIPGDWNSLLVVTANASVADTFVRRFKNNSAGLMRLLEFPVPEFNDQTPGRYSGSFDTDKLTRELDFNFGGMGKRYSVILSHVAAVEAAAKAEYDRFKIDVEFQSAERFWLATITAVYCGAMFANQLHATFNLIELRNFLIQAYKDMRIRVAGEMVIGSSFDNTSDILTKFFKAHPKHMMWTLNCLRGQGGNRDRQKKELHLLHVNSIDDTIHIQWVVSERECRISKDAFDAFLLKHSYQPSIVREGLRRHFGMGAWKQLTLNAGTEFAGGGREPVMIIPVPQGSWLETQLFQYGPDKLAPSHLALVTRSGPLAHLQDASDTSDILP